MPSDMGQCLKRIIKAPLESVWKNIQSERYHSFPGLIHQKCYPFLIMSLQLTAELKNQIY